MSALVTAAEAQALLDGPRVRCDICAKYGASVVSCTACGLTGWVKPRAADIVKGLRAAAPSLARTVVAQATACAALRDAVQEYLAAEDERALAADACDDDPSSENEARLNEADECLDAARTRLAALVGGVS